MSAKRPLPDCTYPYISPFITRLTLSVTIYHNGFRAATSEILAKISAYCVIIPLICSNFPDRRKESRCPVGQQRTSRYRRLHRTCPSPRVFSLLSVVRYPINTLGIFESKFCQLATTCCRQPPRIISDRPPNKPCSRRHTA